MFGQLGVLFIDPTFVTNWSTSAKKIAERGHCSKLPLGEKLVPLCESISLNPKTQRLVRQIPRWLPIRFSGYRYLNVLVRR